MRLRFLLILALASLAAAETTDLRADVAPPARDGWRLLGRVWVRPAGRFDFNQLVAVSIVQSRLMIAIKPDEVWKPRLINARRIIAEAVPDKALWWLMLTETTQLVAPDNRGTTLVILSATAPSVEHAGPLRLAGITVSPGGAIVRGSGVVDGRYVQVEYRADRSRRSPRLTVANKNGRGFDYVADDLFDLLQKDAAVVRTYLGPLLKELAGRDLLLPRAADVYRAFPEIQPTAAEQLQFDQLLEQLDSEYPSAREAAAERMRAGGPPMVLAASRVDLSKLSPQQATQLLVLFEDNTLGERAVATMRNDYQWLRAAEGFPDRRVKDLARELIAEFSD